MLSLNTRSVREKVPSLMSYVTDRHLDLALIQESWIRKCDGSILTEIKEYKYNVSTFRKPVNLEWGGGVASIYKKNLKLNFLKHSSKYNTFEHLACKIETENGPLIVVNIYRRGYSATNKFTVNNFIVEFSEFLEILECYAATIILVGDLNIHVELVTHQTHCFTPGMATKKREASSFLDLLDQFGLKQIVNQPTHNLGGTLGVTIIPKQYSALTVEVGLKDMVCSSDHFHMSINVATKPLYNNTKLVKHVRKLKNLDCERFSDKLVSLDLINKVRTEDVNTATRYYNDMLFTIFDETCPSKTITVNDHEQQPWYHSELREMKRLVRSAERKYYKHRSSSERNELSYLRNLYKSTINMTRSNYIGNFLDENENNLNLVYDRVSYLLGESKTRRLPIGKDDLTLANEFTKYFVDKINIIRSNIENDLGANIVRASYNANTEHEVALTAFQSLSENDVLQLVNEMKCKLNTNDPIPLTYLKKNTSHFIPILQHIVNLSLESGIFPEDLKHGTVSPVIKSEDADSELHKNFRPVTTLPFLSKLLEKACSTQITAYLNEQNLLPQHQSAYLKGHSCETALLKLSNDVQKMLSQGKMVLVVQLDLSAAFDTVDHAVLLHLLEHKYKIKGTVLKWITSYLSGRTFSVKIGSVNGRRVILIYGVPQGSVLGPLLFILYVSDLPCIVASFDISLHSYADDSHLYVGFDPLLNYAETVEKMQRCIMKIEDWMKSNYLQLNVDKTEVLFVAKPRDLSTFNNLSITIGDKCFVSSSTVSVESLGVYFDNSMSVRRMVSETVKRCHYNLKRLHRLRYTLSVKHKILLVKSFILSRVDYCSVLLANASALEIKRLQTVINKSMRFVHLLKKRDSVSTYAKDAHILPMKYRVMYKTCLFVYNIINGDCPHYFNDMLQRKHPNEFNTRLNNDNLLFVQTTGNDTLQYGMIKNWNSLPYSIRCQASKDSFKTLLKTYYFNIAYVL